LLRGNNAILRKAWILLSRQLYENISTSLGAQKMNKI
jgi:hypothetical protein